MRIAALFEWVWRPIAEAIDAWLDTPPKTHGGLVWPLMFWAGAIFVVVAAAIYLVK